MDRHIFRKTAPMGKTRLLLMQTHLLVARMALAARPAAADERYGDPIAHLPVLHVLADRLDHTGQFVAGDVREVYVTVVPHPAVPVAATHAGGFDFEDDAMRLQ